jgi:hypothetical protein
MKVYFYYPTTGIGGVQSLFTRYCYALTNNKIDAEIVGERIIGYDKTNEKFIFQNNIKVKKINFFRWVVSLIFKRNFIVITSGNNWLKLYFILLTFLGKKIYFWSLQPNHFCRFENHVLLKRFVCLYLKLLIKRETIFLMDEEGKNTIEKYYNIKIRRPIFLPVADFIDNVLPEIPSPYVKKNQIKILWVGRLNEEWKTLTLLPLVNLAKESSFIYLTIIGALVPGINSYPLWLSSILGDVKDYNNISVLLNLENEVLKSEYPKYDIVCGMGTVLIEAASKCVPVFSQDLSDDTGYGLWFYDRVGYCLGGIDLVKNSHKRIHIKEAISQIIINKIEISIKCYDHAKKNHNLNEISNSLLQILNL